MYFFSITNITFWYTSKNHILENFQSHLPQNYFFHCKVILPLYPPCFYDNSMNTAVVSLSTNIHKAIFWKLLHKYAFNIDIKLGQAYCSWPKNRTTHRIHYINRYRSPAYTQSDVFLIIHREIIGFPYSWGVFPDSVCASL